MVSFDIIFRDTGCGISKENQQKLFNNFGKLKDDAGANKQGVGLGLSICREIITATGGQVNIESTEGKGTDFIISIKAKSRIDMAKINEAQLNFELFKLLPSIGFD